MEFTNKELEALMERVVEKALKKVAKSSKLKKEEVLLLSNSAAADIAIKTEKAHLKTATWDYLGIPTTCVWPLLDCIGGSQCLKVKAVSHIKSNGIGWSTVGHNAHSDDGPVYIKKFGAESLYASIDDVIAAVLASSPRIGKKVITEFKAKYSM